MACAFDTSDFAAKQWDGDAMDFSPSLPGAYTFTYEASDLCNSVSKSVTVCSVLRFVGATGISPIGGSPSG